MVSKINYGHIFVANKFFDMINEVAVALDISLVYFSSVGIKYFNSPIYRSVCDYSISGEGAF